MKRSMIGLLLILASVLNSGCGWHLRGITQLPSEVRLMSLESQANSAFNQRLQQQLRFNGVSFPKHASANIRLVLSPIQLERSILTVNSLGQTAEYELNAQLEVRLMRLDESPQEYQWTLTGRRIFSNDVNNVLATASEEAQQRIDIENNLIRQLMMRLKNLAASSPSEPAS